MKLMLLLSLVYSSYRDTNLRNIFMTDCLLFQDLHDIASETMTLTDRDTVYVKGNLQAYPNQG